MGLGRTPSPGGEDPDPLNQLSQEKRNLPKENTIYLKKKNDQLQERLQELELLCMQLKKEVCVLREEDEKLKETQKNKVTESTNQKQFEEYCTDEEELAKETVVIAGKQKKQK